MTQPVPTAGQRTGTPHEDQSTLVLTPRPNADRADPIATDAEGRWWFTDETWSYAHGPYPDEATAVARLDAYAATL